jgi:uncharacterized protein
MSDDVEQVAAIWRRRLTDFCGFLRDRGYPLGVGAELDLGRAANCIDLLDRPQFRTACGVALAKSPDDLRFVFGAFDLYWSAVGASSTLPWTGSDVAALAPPRRSPSPSRHRTEGEPDPNPPPVAIPIGTYSASAPGAGHPLEPLSDRAVRAFRHGARRFRREMATAPGRRRGPSRHGMVDLRDTVRQSLRHGGEWVELRHQRRRLTRAEFLILWDVSGSMREHESRFFALVHALESASRSSRVFAFSTRVEEITTEVRRSGYRRALRAVSRRIDRADGGTRIARSLREFTDRFGSLLGETTTLVILSDGWDLGEADRVGEELTHLARRTHRIVWVTPYTRRPGFQPGVGALQSARGEIDQLLGPEDFESRWPLRPFRG